MVDWGKSNTCPEDVLNACTLSEEGIDDGRALWHEGRLAEVA